jgi:hypothetical protein
MTNPFATREAVTVVDHWFALPFVAPLEAGPRYWSILHDLLVTANVQGSLISDAHIAALAIEHEATLYTADGDFRRFAGVRAVNPLI